MLNDASFRLLLVNKRYKALLEAWQHQDFTPAQKKVMARLVEYINELGRIVTKEQGEIEQLL